MTNTQTFNPAYPPTGHTVSQQEVDLFFGLSNQDLPFRFPMQGLWMIGVAIVVGLLLSRTLFGFRLKAIGGNPVAAQLARLPVRSTSSPRSSGAQAWRPSRRCSTSRSSARPSRTPATNLLFQVFAAVIIGGASLSGGRGTAIGTLSGALLLAIIANGLALISAGHLPEQPRGRHRDDRGGRPRPPDPSMRR